MGLSKHSRKKVNSGIYLAINIVTLLISLVTKSLEPFSKV